jgi:anaerobic selenocysteine-containing dehydrogenase
VLPPGADRRALVDVLDALGARLGLAPDTDLMARYVARIPELAAPGAFVADPPRVKGWVHKRVLPDGRWRVAPAPLVAQLAEWDRVRTSPLVAIPRRTTRRMNSALRDVGRGGEDNALWIHPDDAANAGVADGATVAVTSNVGTIYGRAKVTEDIVPGAVSIPHGLLPQNVSVLTDSRPGTTDVLTGMIRQSGIPVTINAGGTESGDMGDTDEAARRQRTTGASSSTTASS